MQYILQCQDAPFIDWASMESITFTPCTVKFCARLKEQEIRIQTNRKVYAGHSIHNDEDIGVCQLFEAVVQTG